MRDSYSSPTLAAIKLQRTRHHNSVVIWNYKNPNILAKSEYPDASKSVSDLAGGHYKKYRFFYSILVSIMNICKLNSTFRDLPVTR